MAVLFEELKDALNAQYAPDSSDACIPNRMEVVSTIRRAQAVLFPGVYKRMESQAEDFTKLNLELARQIALAKRCDLASAEELSDSFMRKLPALKKILLTDVDAIYNGDPAAKSKTEVILCYPGFLAIFIYRVAHLLREMEIPYIPRMMTEYAHEKTGLYLYHHHFLYSDVQKKFLLNAHHLI